WRRSAPTEPQQRKAALAYLYENVPPNAELSQNSLAFGQYLVVRPKDERSQGLDWDNYVLAPVGSRQELLDLLTAPKEVQKERIQKDERLRKAIPPYFLEMPPKECQEVRLHLEAFLATLPREPGKLTRLISHFAVQASWFL